MQDQEASEGNTEQQAIKKEPLSLEELLAKKAKRKPKKRKRANPSFLQKRNVQLKK
jgi:hypothetical protein